MVKPHGGVYCNQTRKMAVWWRIVHGDPHWQVRLDKEGSSILRECPLAAGNGVRVREEGKVRIVVLAAFLLSLAVPAAVSPAPANAAGCQFVLGFKTLHDLIPDTVGQCLVDEHHNAANGDDLQETTAWHGKGGLLAWRKADNWTAFTDGATTWINGPSGLQKRTNADRFSWEADHLLPALRNAEYSLPLSGSTATVFRLSGGTFQDDAQRISVRLLDSATAFGDLNGDGIDDAVVVLAVNTGGSGTFEYAVAVVDRKGVPQQAAYEFLGDRVRVNSVTIANRQITVDMVVAGPNDPLCCPSQRVVKVLGIKVPS